LPWYIHVNRYDDTADGTSVKISGLSSCEFDSAGDTVPEAAGGQADTDAAASVDEGSNIGGFDDGHNVHVVDEHGNDYDDDVGMY
jgi:hypothetical protein